VKKGKPLGVWKRHFLELSSSVVNDVIGGNCKIMGTLPWKQASSSMTITMWLYSRSDMSLSAFKTKGYFRKLSRLLLVHTKTVLFSF